MILKPHYLVLLACAAIPVTLTAHNWPEFRGPTGQGHAEATSLPTTFSQTERVKWRTELPGEGWSSPVIFNNQIWMTTALDDGKSLRALCVDKNNGKLLHNIELFSVEAPEFKHTLNSYASPTPVLEKGRAYFSFGNYGNAAIDTDTGKIAWKSQVLSLGHEVGPGSSPILHNDFFILHCDGTNSQYIAALHKKNGNLAWKTERSVSLENTPTSMRKAYSIPLVITVDGRQEMLSPAAEHLYAYDPATGKELWQVRYPGFSNVPRPLFAHGLVFVCTGFMKPELWAVKPGGNGDMTSDAVVWKYPKQTPSMSSPIIVGDYLFMVSDSGIVTCLDARNGKEQFQERIGGDYSASPIHANGKIYFFSQQGKITVLKSNPTFEILAQNDMPEGFMASPAVSGNSFYLRTKKALYRVE
ncbi:MAG: PQQ-binding-like beta-propeller repeat protein [Verrucomicrobiota bacterium]|nr:PQQ-binding-like beta-propeller repeat protein [Verrucomicrobiota bacterium]